MYYESKDTFVALVFRLRRVYSKRRRMDISQKKPVCCTVLNQCSVELSPAMFPVGRNSVLIAQVVLRLSRVGTIILSKGKHNTRWHWGTLKYS